jgi:hypothetical protein
MDTVKPAMSDNGQMKKLVAVADGKEESTCVEHLTEGLRKAGLQIPDEPSSRPPIPRPEQDCKTL